MPYKEDNIRTINVRNNQWSVTLPKKIMEDNNFRNKERVKVTIDETTGNVIIKRMGGLVE